MPLLAGTRLGPYEILAPIGAGGMGEVYRARDPRLGREVAIKVLPATFSQDAERLRRFEQEARSASALNHPNIITIHEIGSSDSTSYIAMEYVDGTSLRELLASGPLPPKRLLDIGVQVAEGLAKAHAAGIVHRDLKPENVMVSRDGYVKLLDFGLAKLFAAPQDQSSGMQTAIQQETQPGTVMGTVGYMSPEQASGRPVDFRSDQFSLGSILYEMATGKRAFQRDTGAQTLAAIIQDEPEPVAQLNPRAPAPFRWIVERCLQKDLEERYASTRDLARDLKSVRDHLSEAFASSDGAAISAARPRGRGRAVITALAALVLAAIGIAVGRKSVEISHPRFHRLTFRHGTISSARFGPDGQTIFYGAAWAGDPIRLFSTRPESPESSPLSFPRADIFSISPSGEMAISLNPADTESFETIGTLSRMPMAGGAPREILDGVNWADWSPDGSNIAVVRDVAGKSRLEFPVGKVLYESAGWIGHPRVSPDGKLVAFLDHPARGDDAGSVAVVDLNGNRRTLSNDWASEQGLAWRPDGKEIWFTAAREGIGRSIRAVSLAGRERLVLPTPDALTILDIARNGRVLMTKNAYTSGILGHPPGQAKDVDLSLFDWSVPRDLSPDGLTVLFDETGEGGGANHGVYIRATDGSPAVRLGDGFAMAISLDGQQVVSLTLASPRQIVLLPTKTGQPTKFAPDGLNHEQGTFFPDGKRILSSANEGGHGLRLYVQELPAGKPRAISPEGIEFSLTPVSPDGRLIAAIGPDQRLSLYSADGSDSRPLPGSVRGDWPIRWSGDGREIYVYRRDELPCKVFRIELATGRRELWKEIVPDDPAGLIAINRVLIAADGKSYVFSYLRTLSDLYLVEGLL